MFEFAENALMVILSACVTAVCTVHCTVRAFWYGSEGTVVAHYDCAIRQPSDCTDGARYDCTARGRYVCTLSMFLTTRFECKL